MQTTSSCAMSISSSRVAVIALAGAALAAALVARTAAGQEQQPPPRRRQATIEIHGVVPTPQVVTVRPREVPTYSRQVLVPRFYDHDFWPDVQEGYSLISSRLMNGLGSDSLVLAANPVGTPDLFTAPAVGTATPMPAQYTRVRKQYKWCETRFWCPTHSVKVPVPVDSAALLARRQGTPPPPAANGATNARPANQTQGCAPNWWCPPGGVVTSPAATQPTQPVPSLPTTKSPADSTRGGMPSDSARRPPGTSSASPKR